MAHGMVHGSIGQRPLALGLGLWPKACAALLRWASGPAHSSLRRDELLYYYR